MVRKRWRQIGVTAKSTWLSSRGRHLFSLGGRGERGKTEENNKKKTGEGRRRATGQQAQVKLKSRAPGSWNKT